LLVAELHRMKLKILRKLIQLNDNLDLFVKIADRKIDDWHEKYLVIE
jgi:hypothetical protein